MRCDHHRNDAGQRLLAVKNWHKAHKDGLTLGERAADKLRNAMGSWAFVIGFLSFMGAWIIWNTISTLVFDAPPYILLNLGLSLMAGLQGAILLIAAKRMDAISGAMAQHDLETNLAAKEEIESLAQGQLAIIRALTALGAKPERQARQDAETSAAPAIQS